ncbi:glycosyl hydrolase [Salinivibrio sp. PR6]|nr:glycosyl hydrolase [Salinivibrio sp. PR6]
MNLSSFYFSCVACGLTLFSLTAYAAPLTLTHQDTHVTINPSDLRMHWDSLPINDANLAVGQKPQQVVNIRHPAPNQVNWRWMPANIGVSATLDNALTLSMSLDDNAKVTRQRPVSVNWFNLPVEDTQALLLPFSEGMRIPTDHPQWIDYLQASRDGANTTQDLKMPFWTAQIGRQYVSYHLVTATNNRLSFARKHDKLATGAVHTFTPLNRHDPFVVRIKPGQHPLDGAKWYRQWRQEQHQATSLAKKVQQNPETAKLIGATHVYLFGQGPLARDDVKDWWGLKHWALNTSPLPLDDETKAALRELSGDQGWFSKYHKNTLVNGINRALAEIFSATAPTEKDNTIKQQYQAAQQRKKWLASRAGQYLKPADQWGQGLSTEMLDSLHKAGIRQLWLGLDNWMPAFYQPHVVEKAKQAGYLIGPYDSYNTAIPRGVNDSWLTAQLPDVMRTSCAIEQRNGKLKKGFRGNGFYLNPACDVDYVAQRIADIIKYGHFNSLFIDVDATAMAREDYRRDTREVDMLAAFNQRMKSIVDRQAVVLGSEDGNSLTTQGIAFAHGLETIGFGWTDKDMKSNRASPYYLGPWYPDNKPAFFFQPAKVKPLYQALLFAPQFRIPLYQAVFHDEVINSHHWHSDSLKFTNVRAERDLIAMLYNVPAMVHLSRDEATSPSQPRIRAIKHYQQGFMPIHQALWDKALVDFRWLDERGRVQQTQFSDGSTLTANFTDQPVGMSGITVPAKGLVAQLSDGTQVVWSVSEQD